MPRRRSMAPCTTAALAAWLADHTFMVSTSSHHIGAWAPAALARTTASLAALAPYWYGSPPADGALRFMYSPAPRPPDVAHRNSSARHALLENARPPVTPTMPTPKSPDGYATAH